MYNLLFSKKFEFFSNVSVFFPISHFPKMPPPFITISLFGYLLQVIMCRHITIIIIIAFCLAHLNKTTSYFCTSVNAVCFFFSFVVSFDNIFLPIHKADAAKIWHSVECRIWLQPNRPYRVSTSTRARLYSSFCCTLPLLLCVGPATQQQQQIHQNHTKRNEKSEKKSNSNINQSKPMFGLVFNV